MAGTWVSIAPEIRPSKNPDGTLKPFYLSRTFTYRVEDRFELAVMNFADPFGKVAIARIDLAGHMSWREPHPIAPGAWKVDFVADEGYALTPLVPPFVDLLNKVARSDESTTAFAASRRSGAGAWSGRSEKAIAQRHCFRHANVPTRVTRPLQPEGGAGYGSELHPTAEAGAQRPPPNWPQIPCWTGPSRAAIWTRSLGLRCC